MAEEDNIRFENMMDFKNILREDDSSTENVEAEEKGYDSLYYELLEKCIPNNFPSNDDKFYIANEIYAQLKQKELTNEQLMQLRDAAIERLGVRISFQRKELYDYLEKYLNPAEYTKIEPYDAERVSLAGRLYSKLRSLDAMNILELEQLERESRTFIEKREKEIQFEKLKVIEEQRNPNEIESWRQQEEEKRIRLEKKEIDEMARETDVKYAFLFFLIICTLIIILWFFAPKIS